MFLGNLFEFCFGYLFCLLDLFRPQAVETAAAAPAEAAQAPVEAAVAAEAPVATEVAATAEAVVPAEVAPAVFAQSRGATCSRSRCRWCTTCFGSCPVLDQ